MAAKHTTLFSQKDSTCYDKWLRVAKWQGLSQFTCVLWLKVWKHSILGYFSKMADKTLINSKSHFLLENEILPHFLQMIGKYSTLSSKKDSTCYYKSFRIATLHVYATYIKLHHYNFITLWKIMKIKNYTIQVHTFQPSKIRSSYLQRTAETYSFSCAMSHVASW